MTPPVARPPRRVRAGFLLLAWALGGLAPRDARGEGGSPAEELALAREMEARADFASACEVLARLAARLDAPPGATPSLRRQVLGAWVRCAGNAAQPEEFVRALTATLDVHGAQGSMEEVLGQAELAAAPIFEAGLLRDVVDAMVDRIRAHPAFGRRPHRLRHRLLLTRAQAAYRAGDEAAAAMARDVVAEATAAADVASEAVGLLLLAAVEGPMRHRWDAALRALTDLAPRVALRPVAGVPRGAQGLLRAGVRAATEDPSLAPALVAPYLALFVGALEQGTAELGGPEFLAACALEVSIAADRLRSTGEAILAELGRRRDAGALVGRGVRLRCVEAYARVGQWDLARAARTKPADAAPADLAEAGLRIEELLCEAWIESKTNGLPQAKAAIRRALALLPLGIGVPEGAPWWGRLTAVTQGLADPALTAQVEAAVAACRERAVALPSTVPARLRALASRVGREVGDDDLGAATGRLAVALSLRVEDLTVHHAYGEAPQSWPGRWTLETIDLGPILLRVRGARVWVLPASAEEEVDLTLYPTFLVPSEGWLVVHRDGAVRTRTAPRCPPVRR